MMAYGRCWVAFWSPAAFSWVRTCLLLVWLLVLSIWLLVWSYGAKTQLRPTRRGLDWRVESSSRWNEFEKWKEEDLKRRGDGSGSSGSSGSRDTTNVISGRKKWICFRVSISMRTPYSWPLYSSCNQFWKFSHRRIASQLKPSKLWPTASKTVALFFSWFQSGISWSLCFLCCGSILSLTVHSFRSFRIQLQQH